MALLAAIARDIAELVRAGYPEETARRIATGELQMDTASRMERARQQGFDTENIAFHGTRADIGEFVPSVRGKMGPGVYTSPNPRTASRFALPGNRVRMDDALVDREVLDEELLINQGANVLPLLLRGDRMERFDALRQNPDIPMLALAEPSPTGSNQLADSLKERGVTGLEMLATGTGGMRGPVTEQNTFDPNNIRSYYSAAFDPDYTGPNILGASAATAGALGLLAAPEEAEAGPRSQAAQEAIQGVMGMIDPRFDPRVRERERLAALTPVVSERGTLDDIPRIALSDLEGRQFITTMSDRTRAGGLLTGVNDVELDLPVNLQGGQDFMFENPGAVWASAPGVVGQIMREAYRSKDNPVYLPYRMAPTGGDFSKMTGETMISYASANMTRAQKKDLDKAIKSYVTKGKMVKQQDGPSKRVGDGLSIEGWQGVDNPASIEAWRNTPDSVRKELMDMMDKQFRNEGGLGIGEARLAVADPSQVGLRDAGIQNVELISRDQPVIKESGHPSYPFAVPGEGLGRLDDQPMSIFDLIPDARLGEAQRRVGDTVDPLNPSASDIRAVSMKPYSGRIDQATLRRLEDRGVNVNSPAAVDAALMAMYAEDAHNIEVQNQMRALGLDRDPRYEYGNILPIKQDIVTGESSLAYPEIVRGLLGALVDLGSTPKTGVYNPNAILDIAL